IVAEAIRHHVDHINARRQDLYEIELYLALVYEGLARPQRTSTHLRELRRDPRRALREWLSATTTCALLESELNRAIAQLHQKATAFEIQLADGVRPARLGKSDAFRFFRRLVNYTPHKADATSLKYDTHVDYFVSDCAVDCHRSHLDVDDVQVKVLTMKEPPSTTFAHLLE